MKNRNKLFLITAILAATSTQVNAQTMKEKLAAKKAAIEAKIANSGGKYKTYDYEDPTGVSGTYFLNTPLVPKQNTLGLRFDKEKNGNIVNELYINMGKESNMYDAALVEATGRLDEKIQKSANYKHFNIIKSDIFDWRDGDVAFYEVTENVFAIAMDGKVFSVAAKDSSLFSDYDTETAQVLVDQKNATAQAENNKKIRDEWMQNKVYQAYHGKVAFSEVDWKLMKRGTINKPPQVEAEAFSTTLEPHKGLQYNIFFENPPATAYPGKEIDIVYTINGKKYSRMDLRNESAKGSKWIKRLETKDFNYLQSGPRGLFYMNTFHGRYVIDYAFAVGMTENRASFTAGKKVNITVQVYVAKDGEREELLSEGTLSMDYNVDAVAGCEVDEGMWDQIKYVMKD